jgi:hypothetical protein
MGERYRGLQRFASALILAASTWCTAAQAQLTFDSCKVDSEVAADQRSPYQQAALDFTEALLKQDAAQIHLRFTADLRRAITLDQVSSGLLRQIAPMVQGVGAPHVSHSYLVTSYGVGANHTTMCGPITGDNVFLATKSGAKQAHVIVEAESSVHTATFVLWLLADDSKWLVQGFHAQVTTMLGKTADDYRAMARAEHQRGHLFNAAVLLVGAGNLAYRGKDLRLSLWQDIQKEMKAQELPPELKGDPPFTWRFDRDSFRILFLSIWVIEGKLGLLIRREVPSLPDTAAVDDEDRRLIVGFLKQQPEVREVFEFLYVQTMEARSDKVHNAVEWLRK